MLRTIIWPGIDARTTSRYSAKSLRFTFSVAFALVLSLASHVAAQQTLVSIQKHRFFLNGQVTHPGTAAEGLLLNSRMVQAIFDDENPWTIGRSAYPDIGGWDPERNVQEFIEALPAYAARGLRAVTINLQGGSPGWARGDNQAGIVTAFRSDGSLKSSWLNRLDRVIRAADQEGIVVIVGLFYFGQDHRLANEAAVVRAVDGVTDWLLWRGFTNVLIEVNNEANLWYNHPILQPTRVVELITRIKSRSGGRLKVSTSLAGAVMPSSAMLQAVDYVLLHGNGQTALGIASMVDRVRASPAYQARPKPIVFNEDSTSLAKFDTAVARRASWGYYDQGSNNYVDGYQSPPVNWTINTSRKRSFFDHVARFTQTNAPTEPSTTPSPGDLRVTHFTLVNADRDDPIQKFDAISVNSVTLDFARLPTSNLTLVAETSPVNVGSVRFNVNGAVRTENYTPYALAGDTNGDYTAWKLGPGTHVVTATPYTGPNASGTAGTAETLVVTIVDGH
jgi:hypothetical protein